MVKGFRIKGLASIMLARVFCFCAAVPVLAAGTVRSLNLRFEDQYELGVIVEPEITCVSAGISIDSVTWEKDTDQWKPGKKVTAVIEVSSDGGREFLSSYGAESCKISGARLTSAKGDGDTAIIKASYYPVGPAGLPGGGRMECGKSPEGSLEESRSCHGLWDPSLPGRISGSEHHCHRNVKGSFGIYDKRGQLLL